MRRKINLTIFGMEDDICWGCLEEKNKQIVLDKNLTKKDTDENLFSKTNYWSQLFGHIKLL